MLEFPCILAPKKKNKMLESPMVCMQCKEEASPYSQLNGVSQSICDE